MTDLRTMLHDRAAEADRPAPDRLGAVRRRVVAARRRRTAAALAASAAAVAAVVAAGTALVPEVAPQPPAPAGALADTIVSAGVPYRIEERRTGASGEVTWRLPDSDVPRILTWSTPADSGTVRVTGLPVADVVAPAGLGDRYLLSPGAGPTVRLRADDGPLEVAVYAVRDADPRTSLFRPRTPTGQTRLAGEVGDPGQGRVSAVVPREAPGARGIAMACWGPGADDLVLRVVSTSGEIGSMGCSAERPVAPDANGGAFTTAGSLAGARLTATVVDADDRPVTPPDDLRLGVAVYADPGGVGAALTEQDGVLWRLEETRSVEGARPSVDVDTRRPVLAWVANDSSREVVVRTEGQEGDLRFGGGGATSQRLWAGDPRTTLSLAFAGGEGEARVLVYRRADGPWSE